ncbi:hypothetical protein M406DRAFT_44371 [Cryphonectria parasitica EP155]|uniref:Amino acid transporter n=1 Tax=Cryphonectria parasitica (strain ATCC 38755 / EP155) TaxID=660469 RepID=A0A9P5CSW1_CRYP1|nr:uncharacterized protein M406DRAFT_44371 [Cryphonectria parasitica EP155]KAF3768771.1 hypothetical protein M406DRAFT_44371 [Cryphonectria parasitica EP155]
MEQDLSDENVVDSKKGNQDDRAHMLRLGKTQQLRRDFRFISMFGFSMILGSSWEVALAMLSMGLLNGGTAGLIWVFLCCWVGFMFINISMAEMGSMAPTSGGQYHWVSEFAPRKYQKQISYIMGWLCVLGWQAGCASTAFMAGTSIQGLIVLGNPNYVYENWHGTLLSIASGAFAVMFNTLLARKLALVEGIILVLHVSSFFGVLVTLWVLSPIADAKTVFTQFSDGGGWGSLGGSALVGITAAIVPNLGADAAVHMSEELRDAGKTLPLSMIMTSFFNGLFAWITVITICFCLGNVTDVLASPTGYPYMAVFLNSTQSAKGATAMAVWIALMFNFCNLTMVATASRQLFAFARDNGVPCSSWFSRVSHDIPVNAILTTFIVTCLLCLINIGSSVALNSIVSLSTNALLSSYMCSIGCMAWRRITGQPLLPSKFSLGRWGLAVNLVSEVFLVVMFILAFFPEVKNPDPEEMNWNILIYGTVVTGSVVYYLFKGRYVYEGPVEYVRKLE